MNVIAIDGPSASGKSTVARLLAKRLGHLYVDSGALYRAVTWRCLERNCPVDDPAAVAVILPMLTMDFHTESGAVRFHIDGLIPGDAIRTRTVTDAVSRVASVPAVRQQVNEWLRGMTTFGPLVVEGRDIGSAVFPGAQHKFYLDASPEERARRRFNELEKQAGSIHDVESSLARRDKLDSSRSMDPLRIPPGATVIDSTGLTQEQVVDMINQHVKQVT